MSAFPETIPPIRLGKDVLKISLQFEDAFALFLTNKWKAEEVGELRSSSALHKIIIFDKTLIKMLRVRTITS
jgi:hypothetical protein